MALAPLTAVASAKFLWVPLIGPVVHYTRRHGLRAALRRAVTAIERPFRGNRMIVFYLDLSPSSVGAVRPTVAVTVERKSSRAEIEPSDLERIVQAWNPGLASRQLVERFDEGASLWLCRSNPG